MAYPLGAAGGAGGGNPPAPPLGQPPFVNPLIGQAAQLAMGAGGLQLAGAGAQMLGNPPGQPVNVGLQGGQQNVGFQGPPFQVGFESEKITLSFTSSGGFYIEANEQRLQANQEKLNTAFAEFREGMIRSKAVSGPAKDMIPFANLRGLLVDTALGIVIYEEVMNPGAPAGIPLEIETKEISLEDLLKAHPDLKLLLDKLNTVMDDIWGDKGSKISSHTLGSRLNANHIEPFHTEDPSIKKLQRKGYDEGAILINNKPRWGYQLVQKTMTTVYEAYKKKVLARPEQDDRKNELLKAALKRMQSGLIALHALEQQLKGRQEVLKEPTLPEGALADEQKTHEASLKAYTKEREAIASGLQNLYQVDWLVLFSALAAGGEPIASNLPIEDQRKQGVERADQVCEFVDSLVFDEGKKMDEEILGFKNRPKELFREFQGNKGPYSKKPPTSNYAIEAGGVACGLIPNEKLRHAAYLWYNRNHNKTLRVSGSIEEAIVRIVSGRGSPEQGLPSLNSQIGAPLVGQVGGPALPPLGAQAGGQPQAGAAVQPAEEAPTPRNLPSIFCKMLDGVRIDKIDEVVNQSVGNVFNPPTANAQVGPSVPDDLNDASKSQFFIEESCKILRPWVPSKKGP